MDIDPESVKDQNDVGLSILKQLLEKEAEGKNLVFSPLSIYMMLTLLAAGASRGKMLHDLLSFLKFKSIHELNSFLSKLFAFVLRGTSAAGGPCVTTANGVWVADDLPVKLSFQKLLETLYKGKLNQVDFLNKSSEVIDEANAWVNKETRGLIPKIFDNDSVDETTRMILANTVYFKSGWSYQFSRSSTKKRRFHLLDGSPVKVPFMSSLKKQAVSVFDAFQVASLSYANSDYGNHRRFSMLIFLPNDRRGLPSLIQRACSESGFLDRHVPPYSVDVKKFKIPKFKFQFQFEPVEILKDLRLQSLFSSGSGFAEMVEGPAGRDLEISNMIHKAVISLNEEGTEAAAVTECGMILGCSMKRKPVRTTKFVADHPFFFIIKEEVTATILFIGQIHSLLFHKLLETLYKGKLNQVVLYP